MSGASISADRSDVLETSFDHAEVTVGTSAVEAKVGGSRMTARQLVGIYNNSNVTVYWGKSSVTTSGSTKGFPIFKDQTIYIPVGDIAVYLIAGSSDNSVLVQEFA